MAVYIVAMSGKNFATGDEYEEFVDKILGVYSSLHAAKNRVTNEVSYRRSPDYKKVWAESYPACREFYKDVRVIYGVNKKEDTDPNVGIEKSTYATVYLNTDSRNIPNYALWAWQYDIWECEVRD